ncbi:MAG: hypothetical protein HY706_07870 [Candidatus Hydrogenedentes bacterium]|nr:hypothetical protein [Candidatus Hydrogenedentota bacterium]
MLFVKSFKGYEDKTAQLDAAVNQWIVSKRVEAVDIKAVLSHEPAGRAGSGDLIYVVLYRAAAPLE